MPRLPPAHRVDNFGGPLHAKWEVDSEVTAHRSDNMMKVAEAFSGSVEVDYKTRGQCREAGKPRAEQLTLSQKWFVMLQYFTAEKRSGQLLFPG